MPSDIILQTQGLTKEFLGFAAVSAVDLQVKRGSIHALIGPNGAGKTTVFNLLTKFHKPTSGTIRFNGIDITGETWAPVAGAVTIVGLENVLADKVGTWVRVIMGLIFVACVLLFRRGLVGEISALFNKRASHASRP